MLQRPLIEWSQYSQVRSHNKAPVLHLPTIIIKIKHRLGSKAHCLLLHNLLGSSHTMYHEWTYHEWTVIPEGVVR